ncbi:MAG: 16S rRNA (guanine(966)-N(2))-methyltransferase RsmD [Proteobacteria bacterium]|nr:MAG: 16S rRNA (guanine(966)-N(2))-methyltransferase RsmD [Pseudomonadota bacterium]
MQKRKAKRSAKVGPASRGGTGFVRIIGGQWRSRKVPFPDVSGLRPSTDRVRETLFNWLMHSTCGANCLDLFCGSGVLGLEALSRGAARLTALDTNAQVVARLKDNLALLQCDRAQVLQADALQWLASQSEPKPFDLVFLDPPFRQSLLHQSIRLLCDTRLLADGAKVYVECERELNVQLPAHWKKLKEKQAGQLSYRLYVVE